MFSDGGISTAFTLALGYLTYLGYRHLLLISKVRKMNRNDESCSKGVLFCPSMPVCRMTPGSWTDISIGGDWSFYFNKSNLYERKGWKSFITVPFFPAGSLCTFVADAKALKEILNDRLKYPKSMETIQILNIYGLSVATTEGEEWKRHRRISQPAFSERNIRLVWSAATRIVEELTEDVWKNEKEVVGEYTFTDT